MEKFSSDWLSLREQEDLLARNTKVLECVKNYLRNEQRLNILDIGCGTGATMRVLQPEFTQPQHWTLLDADKELLVQAQCFNQPLVYDSNITMKTECVDLTEDFGFLQRKCSIVTATAFLDLVSESWIQKFAQALKDNNHRFYCSITPTCSIELIPIESLDDEVINAFNTHRYTDKGFGLSLGGDAAKYTLEIFQNLGYQLTSAFDTWGNRHPNKAFRKILNLKLIEGISHAASQTKLLDPLELEHWSKSRLDSIQNDEFEISFEILDFFAAPSF